MEDKIELRNSVHKWSIGVLLRRFVWQYLCQPIFWILPGPLSWLKVILLRLWGAKVGYGVLIRQRVHVLMPWNLVIGDVVAVGTGVNIYNFACVTIGRQVVISQNVFLCTGTHDHQHRDMPLCYKAIAIESFAWIAANAFIGPGVAIHEGGVVGACSVVMRDTPAWTVVAGNPAKTVKQRVIARNKEQPKK